MKKFLLLFLSTGLLAQQQPNPEKLKSDFNSNFSKQQTAVFEENKGQMKDQNWQPRPDVLFYGKSEGMDYFIRTNGMSYQLSRVESWKEEEAIKGLPDNKNKTKVPDQIGTYRVDAKWIAANENYSSEKGKELPGYNNYYNVPEGVDPALFVKKYEAVTLKNLWNGIDIHYYSSDGFLETDYLVAPGADYRQIQMEIKGADLSIDAEGYLVMKTPFGEIREGKLKVYQENKLISAQWKITQKADKIWHVSFDIPDFKPALAMRIDPIVRVWGTYYGGSGNEIAGSTDIDLSNNLYLTGRTNSQSNISSGGHQNSFGGNYDAFLIKFDTNGNRLWATYYGDSADELDSYCSTDLNKNIYLSGTTKSAINIAFMGFQNNKSGLTDNDAYLVKFDSLGLRIWASYYGGIGEESGLSCATDNNGNIYLAGSTSSSNNISSNGHQSNIANGYDAFLVKFNSSGQRVWSTYYGTGGFDIGYSCKADKFGNIYLVGSTGDPTLPGGIGSGNTISFNGFQNSFGGASDGFLVKFNSAGIRQWGTYFGGADNDFARSCIIDSSSNIYLTGYTNSQNNISFLGHQNSIGGNNDAFLAKFNSSGQRIWSTYYGGSNIDECLSSALDNNENVYITGLTYSTDNISFNGYQNDINGDSSFSDLFLVKFDKNGQRIWGTYLGGTSGEGNGFCIIDKTYNIYISGITNSNNEISLQGHQNSLGGQTDAFLIKFGQPKISGHFWNDITNDCFRNLNERNLNNEFRLSIQPGNIITQSRNGFWELDSLPSGTYTISVDSSNRKWLATCPTTQSFTVVHPDSFVQGPNFGFVAAYPCPSPNVSVVMPIMRRGFSGQLIHVQACNESTATGILDSAFTVLTLPPQISVQSASIPYTALGNNRFRFEHDTLYPGECVNFTISATVSTTAINGQTLCMSAELFPQANCVFDSIPTPYDESPSGSITPCTLPWDRSSLRVEGECIGDSVRFVIYNTGELGGGDMDCFAPVRVYVDGQWVILDSIRIVGGDSVVFIFAGTGGTIRLEADQHPLHPGNSHPNASVENCGNGTWTPGEIITMPQDDADPVIDIYCGQVTAPMDPNDKTGFPLGVGTNHNIRQNQQIEYLIRFQNVGTDTAFNIVIRDTLSTDLNIFTVQSGVASHPYEFRMYGPRVLEWKFNNIMLPDSNTNEPASNGFVKFTVEQNPDLPFGTVIENSAAIYFDFEAPVITNTYFHTIHDFSISVSVEPIEGTDKYLAVKVIPNPFSTSAAIQIEGLENYENLSLEIFNLSGQKLFNTTNNRQNSFEITKNDLAQGIYFFNIIQDKKIIAKGKLVVQ